MEGSFHRRELNSPALAFSSNEGRQIFRESMEDEFLEGYYALAENYMTQGHVAFCGLGSLTMALNALLVDPKRIWQGNPPHPIYPSPISRFILLEAHRLLAMK
jgi:glutathione gamma-glutamylcysteinyltransferase